MRFALIFPCALLTANACAYQPHTEAKPLIGAFPVLARANPPGMLAGDPSDAIRTRYETVVTKCVSSSANYSDDLAKADDRSTNWKSIANGVTGVIAVAGGTTTAATADNSPTTSKSVGVATAVLGLVGAGVGAFIAPGKSEHDFITGKVANIEKTRADLTSIVTQHGFDPSKWDGGVQGAWSTDVGTLDGLCTYQKFVTRQTVPQP